MSLSIQFNLDAFLASNNASRSHRTLHGSLEKFAGDGPIVSEADDAAGSAISVRVAAALLRGDAEESGLGNAVSFLQAQESLLKSTRLALLRMSEIATLARESTKNAQPIAADHAEFQDLRRQVAHLSSERFNGIAVFQSAVAEEFSSPPGWDALRLSLSKDGEGSEGMMVPALRVEPWLDMAIRGFVSFADPTDPGRRIFVPNPPQDSRGYFDSGEVFDLEQTTTVIQRWTETFTLPTEHLWRSALIPAQDDTASARLNCIVRPAPISVMVPVTISHPASPPLRSLGGGNYEIQPPTRPSYVTTLTYRQLAEILRTGHSKDPLHLGMTLTGSITVKYAPPASYTRAEDGSTTRTIFLDKASEEARLTSTLEPLNGNGLSVNVSSVSDSVLHSDGAFEFETVLSRALGSLARMLAQNRAEQSRLSCAAEFLAANQVNSEQSGGRITDVGVAEESGQKARLKVLHQAASALLAQANVAPEMILKLLS